MTKSNAHDLTIRIRFNKPISRGAAQRAVQNTICGMKIYATIDEKERDDWQTGKVAKSCKGM